VSESTSDTREREIARSLHQALEAGSARGPVRHELGGSIDAGYRVQEHLIRAREIDGAIRVGRKVGLTSEAVQRQLGVDQPDFGVLLDVMDATGQSEVPFDALVAPRIEAELAFHIADDVTDPESVLRCVEFVSPALEIVDSRIAGWDISIVDTIADNASSAMFVLGDRVRLAEVDTRAVEMTMTKNGEVVSVGDGSACLGDPRAAVVWVARTAHDLGRPLRAGEVILSGALGPMVAFERGCEFVATLTGVGSVSATAAGQKMQGK
jgi:2-keto-4-pentenoate hydratase